MKPKILTLLLVISSFMLNGQEIKLNSAVLSSAGTNAELHNVNISKWRLGEVHLIVLQRNEPVELSETNWNVFAYPNPFKETLNLDFKTKELMEFTIQLADVTGRKIWFSEAKKLTPNQVVSLDLTHLASGMYLLSLTPKDKKTQRMIKVQKH